MKLKQQGLVLLILPLIGQMFFVGLLTHTLDDLDDAAQREADAKQLFLSLQEIRAKIQEVWVMCVGHQFYNSSTTLSKVEKLEVFIRDRLRTVYSLASDDPDATRCLDEYTQLVEGFDKLVPATLNQRVDELDKRKLEWGVFIRKLVSQEQKLFNLYRPTLREFSSKASLERQNLFYLVILAVTVNSVIVVSLAVLLGRTTNARLQLLIDNISRFRDGELQLQPVGGSDELTELDTEFRTMIQVRTEAEELQRSLYAMVSHDLRSPLTALSMTINIIMDWESGSLSAELKPRLARMRTVINRLVMFAQSILDLEQSTTGNIQLSLAPCSSHALIDAAIEMVRELASEKEIQIITDTSNSDLDAPRASKDDIILVCDENRVIQVLINLLSNAITRSTRGSKIEVSIIVEPDGRSRFLVHSQCPGLTETEKEQLLRDNFQIGAKQDCKQDIELGLSISKLLIDAHSGQLGSESTASGGSTIWFTLPKVSLEGYQQA